MRFLTGVCGAILLAVVLWDAFETIILPRRVNRRFRITRLFYRSTWYPWRATAQHLPSKRREAFLGFFGPLSLLLLLSLWAAGIIFSFGMLQWAAGSAVTPAGTPPPFGTDLYLSGTTFFTLGLGDVVPHTELAKVLMVIESGTGFAFLAIVIGYLPVIYQGFSRREGPIALLDARAGSPPTAGELLWRHRTDTTLEALTDLLRDWEHWAADVLESHLSYPVLAYFRSQHNNQSWLAALTTILDASAMAVVCFDGRCARQAEMTFAMARHTAVDLAQVFSTPPLERHDERVTEADLLALRARLTAGGMRLRVVEGTEEQLTALRRQYEPFVIALARYLTVQLPPWVRQADRPDNWQTSAWDRLNRPPEPDEPVTGRAEDHV